MDKLEVYRELKKLYPTLTDKPVFEYDFLFEHFLEIFRQSGGEWNDDVAGRYLRRLKRSIKKTRTTV